MMDKRKEKRKKQKIREIREIKSDVKEVSKHEKSSFLEKEVEKKDKELSIRFADSKEIEINNAPIILREIPLDIEQNTIPQLLQVQQPSRPARTVEYERGGRNPYDTRIRADDTPSPTEIRAANVSPGFYPGTQVFDKRKVIDNPDIDQSANIERKYEQDNKKKRYTWDG